MTDARGILGVAFNASDEEIRCAYLGKVKEHPPDRSPERFEQIRDAYETLRDPRKRIRDMLLSVNPHAPLRSLIEDEVAPRRYCGPNHWLEVLKRK